MYIINIHQTGLIHVHTHITIQLSYSDSRNNDMVAAGYGSARIKCRQELQSFVVLIQLSG